MQRLYKLNLKRGIAAVLSLATLTACGPAATPTPQAPPAVQAVAQPAAAVPTHVSVQEAAKLHTDGAYILDVREPSEWNEFHMPDSTLIPLGQLSGRVSELPKDRPIVVVCRSGNRSQIGRDALLQAGFTNVTSMDGGLTSWRAGGLPVVSGP